ncbi:MAG: lysyl oxidase family protein, partial [Candidatus Limnocylindrales bacterium]
MCQEVGSTVGLRKRRRFDAATAAVALLALLATTLAIGPVGAAAVPADRLPDLAMARPRDLRIQAINGHRRLRFTGIIVNLGAGPFETRAFRKYIRAKTMVVRQRIYNNAGGHRTIVTSALIKYAGDGHDHWHVQKVAGYELYAGSGDGPVLRRGAKVGFCFFDTRPFRLSLARAPRSRQYLERGCGTHASRSIKIGLSVGWSDIYPWNFAWQWIDVTGLPAGQYLLKLIADPKASFVE